MERKSVKKLKAYNPELFDAEYKLDANENSYEFPEKLKKRILKKIEKISLNRYPDPLGRELKIAIAKKLKVAAGNIVIGNGSDELLGYLMQGYIESGDSIVVPVPTFEMYSIIGIINGANVVKIPLDKDFDLDLKGMLTEVRKKRCKFTFISYPNNPTGNCFLESKILKIIEAAKGFVVLDEAYYEFSGKTFLNRLKKYKNLIVTRTFSKAYSMAGLRLGYMIADRKIVDVVNKVRLPYNVNSVSQFIAKEAVNNDHEMQNSIFEIIKEREQVCKKIEDKFKIVKSDANFVFIKFKDVDKAIRMFRKNKISIRVFKGKLKNYARITIGKPVENRAVLKVLDRLG